MNRFRLLSAVAAVLLATASLFAQTLPPEVAKDPSSLPQRNLLVEWRVSGQGLNEQRSAGIEVGRWQGIIENLSRSWPEAGRDAIVTIQAGAGGTEACDWTAILLRAYMRWAERHGFATEIVDSTEGEGAGYRSVVLEIRGRNAFGWLRAERGVHRLVRISPFNSEGKRQTSFAAIDVSPEIDDTIEIDIPNRTINLLVSDEVLAARTVEMGLGEHQGLRAIGQTALGLDLPMLREVFLQTGANSQVLKTDGEDMQNRDHSCFFSASHAAKDSGIALRLAQEKGLNLPLAAATKAQYDRMVTLGLENSTSQALLN